MVLQTASSISAPDTNVCIDAAHPEAHSRGSAIVTVERAMRIVSLNTGLPQEVAWRGRTVTTAIFKNPVEGPVSLRPLNLDGDRQADLSVHGGAFKAVYCYPHEHYAWWTQQLQRRELPMGMFGENLTTEGLDEASIHIGDELSIGTAQLIVTQPRLPCYKLGIRFESDAIVKRFLASGRTGFYLAVQREGSVAAGDEIRVRSLDPRRVPVAEITRLYVLKSFVPDDVAIARRAMEIAALPGSWKEYFQERGVRG
jgi:MOSC domain-containing protein YiiM